MNTRRYVIAALLTVAAASADAQTPAAPDSTPAFNYPRNTAERVEIAPEKVIDEVEWIVGDEAILKSEIEGMREQAAMEGIKFKGNPDCAIPEQLAVQKLFLHQAAIDSIEVSEAEVSQTIDQQMNYWIQMVGSKEKLEEYKKQTVAEMRQQMHDDVHDRMMIDRMKRKLVEDVKVTPAEVKAYFRNVPEDSIPFVPTTVEVQILTQTPKVSKDEINRVKDQLRDFTDRVNSGETSFSSLARLYSEDPGSARQGGELDYVGRGMLDPAFAAVAFNLTDPKKVSKIVESEFGYHIIQLIDKKGDKVKVRHILLKPNVETSAIDASLARLDSIADDIRKGEFSFDDAASYLSDDKDTKNNHGLMFNSTSDSRTSRIQMQDLPSEVAKVVDGLQVGEVSKPFTMTNSRGKQVCVIAKLKSRTDGHKATVQEDFQVLKNVVAEKQREKVIHEWVVNKIKNTYVKMKDRYKNCDFEYQGWIK